MGIDEINLRKRLYASDQTTVWHDLPHCRLGWIAQSGITPHIDMAVGKAVFPENGGHGPHRHPDAGEIIFVVSGEAEQGVHDQIFPLKAGDSAIIPQNAVHWTRNIGIGPLEILVVFSHGNPSTIDVSQ